LFPASPATYSAPPYHGYLPVVTLRMGRTDYDSFTAVPQILAELRRALDEVPEV